jgi:hypothetical protein
MWAELGRKVFRVKWGHKDCGIVEAGRKFEDAWRMKKDFWW